MLHFDRVAVRPPALWFVVASLLLSSACGCGSEPASIGDDLAQGFVSDVASVGRSSDADPRVGGGSGKGGGAAPPPEASVDDEGSDEAGRAISEADIVARYSSGSAEGHERRMAIYVLDISSASPTVVTSVDVAPTA